MSQSSHFWSLSLTQTLLVTLIYLTVYICALLFKSAADVKAVRVAADASPAIGVRVSVKKCNT